MQTEDVRFVAAQAARLALRAVRGAIARLGKISALVATANAWFLSAARKGSWFALPRPDREGPLRERDFSWNANTAPAIGALAAVPGGMAVRSSVGRTREFLIAAIATAFLLHTVAFLVFFIGLPKEEMRSEPSTIPVELVMAPPPEPKALAVRQQPVLEQSKRESGGDPDRAAGQAPDVTPELKDAPEPLQALEPVEPPTPPAPATAVAQPAPSLPKRKPTPAALPHTDRPPAPLHNDSALVGEGGGDRYLNAMRDRIMSKLVYPDAAHSLRLYGVAIYEVLLDRQGKLVAVETRLSSGEGILDAAGINAIQHSAPFGPVPADVPGDRIGIEIRLPMQP